MKTPKRQSVYSRGIIRRIKREAMKIKGATSVCHIHPRAYCIAKPAPLCAVFVTPWMDAEPQIRNREFSSSHVIHEEVGAVRVGEWYSLAYVVTDGNMGLRVIELEEGER